MNAQFYQILRFDKERHAKNRYLYVITTVEENEETVWEGKINQVTKVLKNQESRLKKDFDEKLDAKIKKLEV